MNQVPSAEARPEIANMMKLGSHDVNYHDVGDGPPVLLIHGSGPGVTAWANWRLNMPVLAEQFRVIAPDMFGFGYSASRGKIENKQVWVDQLTGMLDALNIERVSIVGNSFGGAITLAFMIAHPDRVERAVLIGSVGLNFPITPALQHVWGYEPSVEQMYETLKFLAWDHSMLTDDLVRSRYEASKRPEAHDPYHATFGSSDRQANITMLSSREDEIAKLRHETLILHGISDQVIPPGVSMRLVELLPRADLHVFAECGHWVQIERMASFNRMVAAHFRNGLKA